MKAPFKLASVESWTGYVKDEEVDFRQVVPRMQVDPSTEMSRQSAQNSDCGQHRR